MKIRIKREKIFFTVTWLRWILALVVAFAIFFDRRLIAYYMFIITALVGFFENFIARKYPSPLRSIVDFFADKLLVNLTAITLTIKGILPVWVTLIILARDMLTIVGGAVLLYKDLRNEFKPTLLGKISYFFQLIALLPPMISLQIDWIFMGTALALTIASGIYALYKSEFRFIRRKTNIDDFRILSLLKFADLLTFVNVALGLVSIVFAISNNFKYAAITMLISVGFDYLDGKVATSMHQQNALGKELDSLADTVSFGVAPAIFGFSLMQLASKQIQITIGIIAFTIFLSCGILRLARFNIMDSKGVFRGMPITLNGIIIPLAYFIGSRFYADAYVRFFPYLYLLLGILMVSSIRIKKLT